MNSRGLCALVLSTLAVACSSLPGESCNQDEDCGPAGICTDASCSSDGLHRRGSALVVSPHSVHRDVVAGVKPQSGWFYLTNRSWQGHLYAVVCDSGATASPSTGHLNAGDRRTITLDLQPPPAGASTVNCNVTSSTHATAYDSFTLTLNATGGTGGDFSVAVNPAALSLPAAGSGSASVAITPSANFAGDVTLSLSNLPAGATASFDNPTIAGGSGTATLTVQAGSAAAGNYSIDISATGGGLLHAATIGLRIAAAVPAPDFSVSGNPGALSVVAGGSGASSITLTPSGGFASNVALLVTGLPSGATASFAQTSIASGSGSTLLTVQTGAAGVGNSTLTVTASGGGLSHTVTIGLTISARPPPADFSLSANPASLAVVAGGSAATSTIAALPSGGFASDLTLSFSGAPKGLNLSLSPATIAGGSGSSTLSVQAAGSAPGSFTITVTATGGGSSHTAMIALSVAPAPDFAATANPGALSITAGGAAATSAVSITPSAGFSSAVSLSVAGQPGGATATFDRSIVNGGSGSATLTVQAPSAAAGNYPLTITASGGGLTHTTALELSIAAAAPPPDFTVLARPSSLALISGGAAGTSSIQIAPVNGFARDVALMVTGAPPGATATFAAPTVFGGSGSATLTVQPGSATAGSYTLVVSASGGGIAHGVSIALSLAPAPSFALSLSPTSLSLTAGASGSTQATVTPSNGFSSLVSFSIAGLPSGASSSFSPTSLGAGAGSSTLTLQSGTAAAGTYPLTVTASGGGLSHSAPFSLSIAAACTHDTWGSWAQGFFGNNCTMCHTAFTSYVNVSNDRSNIQTRISNNTMPAGGGSLTASDKARILQWISCGLPQ